MWRTSTLTAGRRLKAGPPHPRSASALQPNTQPAAPLVNATYELSIYKYVQ